MKKKKKEREKREKSKEETWNTTPWYQSWWTVSSLVEGCLLSLFLSFSSFFLSSSIRSLSIYYVVVLWDGREFFTCQKMSEGEKERREERVVMIGKNFDASTSKRHLSFNSNTNRVNSFFLFLSLFLFHSLSYVSLLSFLHEGQSYESWSSIFFLICLFLSLSFFFTPHLIEVFLPWYEMLREGNQEKESKEELLFKTWKNGERKKRRRIAHFSYLSKRRTDEERGEKRKKKRKEE